MHSPRDPVTRALRGVRVGICAACWSGVPLEPGQLQALSADPQVQWRASLSFRILQGLWAQYQRSVATLSAVVRASWLISFIKFTPA
jgi:hypothetical protein